LVEGNIINGSGPTDTSPDEAQQGIQIEPSVGGTIRNNRVSNLSSGVPTPFSKSYGILAYDSSRFLQSPIFAIQPLRIENNVLVNNQNAIGVARGDNCQVLNNFVSGGAPDADGLRISGTNLTVSFNQFTNVARGIILFGNDADFGTKAGIARGVAVV